MIEKQKAMKVNERLYVSGLLQEFDEAVEKKNVDEIIKILKIVELEDESIKAILKDKGFFYDFLLNSP